MNDASPVRSLPEHLTQNWVIAKPGATGKAGMVVSQCRTAALVGTEVLRAGGNAADAAVATAFALAVLEPWNSGLGGIGHTVVQPAQGAAEVCDFGPVAPLKLDPARFELTGATKSDLFTWPEVKGDINIHGPLSFVAPSSVAGYAAVHARHGRMKLAELIAPAVGLAKRGLPADWFTALKIASSAKDLRRYAESAHIYLPDGLPPAPPYQGDPAPIHQGNLAATLETLMRDGIASFYTGDIARSIAKDVADAGGALTMEDLAAVAPRWNPALNIEHRGTTLHAAPGMTAGPTLARVLSLMAGAPYGAAPDAAWFAHFARAMRQAYKERLDGAPAAATHTTHLTVADKDGMMVSMTTTLLSSMGSRYVLPTSGVLMNNGVMWFDPRPGAANGIAPGKRPLTNMCPVVATKNGRPVMAAGASGGRKILAAVAQMLAFTLDFGMTPEEAGHHPRIDVSGPDKVSADPRLPAAVLDALRADGSLALAQHTVLPVNYACPNLIARGEDGTLSGISDAMIPWSAAVAA
jgi:gamma-glutamyltranspeptidase / glutathione hydrolase